MKVLVVGLLLFLFAVPASAEPMADLTISQTDNAVQLVEAFNAGFIVSISEASTSHCVWLTETAGTCTDITTHQGWRLCRKTGQPDPVTWVFLASEGYVGQVCVMAEDTGVVLKRSKR